ncbi:MAG: inositol monophosphatase family protein [Spirochaetota bacterium]
MIGDLHLHTNHSDGSQSPAEALVAARERGLDFVSYVDHDTTAGTAEAVRIGRRLGIAVIPGVEISAYDFQRSRKVHILGYNYRLPATNIEALCRPLREARHANTLRQIGEIRAAGYEISEADVREHAAGPDPCLYKQHIMLALIAAGYTSSIYSPLYTQLFRSGGPAAHDIEYADAREAIRAIHADGGLAVLAHPGQLDSYDAVGDLVEAGLDGIELFHEDHARSDHRRIRDIAERHDLFTTGGSDDHGEYGSEVHVGEICAPPGALEAITAPADDDIAWCVQLVRDAARIAREGVATSISVELKNGDIRDLVTEYDVAVERRLAEAIRARFPEHGLITEEDDHEKSPPGSPIWIIDPIDGTTNFATSHSCFAVSVAHYRGAEPLFGIVYDVMADELYLGVAGEGAWLNGVRLGPVWGGRPKPLERCVVEVSLTAVDRLRRRGHDVIGPLATEFRAQRSHGSAAIGICRIAAETLDVYVASTLSAWDYAAAVIVLAEAGGAAIVVKEGGDSDSWMDTGKRIFAAAGHPETLRAARSAALPDLPHERERYYTF